MEEIFSRNFLYSDRWKDIKKVSMKININLVENCTSCMACRSHCPVKCIDIIPDRLGHSRTFATDKCIECKACLKVCPQTTDALVKTPIKAVAAWNPDMAKRESSSSGGVATIIAENFIGDGVVYGCRFVSPFAFKHVRCTTVEEIQTLRGSKYVFGDMDGVYDQISQDLKMGKKVLFIGIPCQVAGINNYFRRRSANLYTIDLLCHGTPSVSMLKRSIPKDILLQEIDNISFRNNLSYQVSLWKNKEKLWERPANREWFLKGFLKDLFSKESCFSCKYAQHKRTGDISLGDYWGALSEDLECDRSKGLNVCVMNSIKGIELMQSVADKLKATQVSLSEELSGNLQFSKSACHTWRTRLFRRVYEKFGYRISVLLAMPDVILKNLLLK